MYSYRTTDWIKKWRECFKPIAIAPSESQSLRRAYQLLELLSKERNIPEGKYFLFPVNVGFVAR